MNRPLNHAALEEALATKGFNQAQLAEKIGVTRAAVSKWLTGKSSPRARELLKVAKLLDMTYQQLVKPSESQQTGKPLVAFRKRASARTTLEHIAHAQEMGRLLEPMASCLPFDRFLAAPRLKNPSLDYHYIQSLVSEVRKELKIDPIGELEFPRLIGKFAQLQAVLIPVMWGQKDRHENALHVHLPNSKTTWIYLNLDSHLYDFKFWMAHELGHVLSLDLLVDGEMEKAEDFSDAFAGALLFPQAAAEKAHAVYCKCHRPEQRMQFVLKVAREYIVSPITVYKGMNRYAQEFGKPFGAIPDSMLYPEIAEFKKSCSSASEILFDRKKPSADRYMRVCEEIFETPLFKALGKYLKESPQSDSMISRILDLPLADAKELHKALV